MRIIVIHGNSGGNATWDLMAEEFNDTLSIVKEFSLRYLLRFDPDIIVLSDVAGYPYQFTEQEITVINEFIRIRSAWGKIVYILGTYALFSYWTHYNNKILGPLFGLCADNHYGTADLDGPPKYVGESEFIDTQYGYPRSQVPIGGWLNDAKDGIHPDLLEPGANVRLLARSTDDKCVVFNYTGTTHISMYISHMPEFDIRSRYFLRVAMEFLLSQRPQRSLVSLATHVIARNHETLDLSQLPEDIMDAVTSTIEYRQKYVHLLESPDADMFYVSHIVTPHGAIHRNQL